MNRPSLSQCFAFCALILCSGGPGCLATVRLFAPGEFDSEIPPPRPNYSLPAGWHARPETEDAADRTPPGLVDGQSRAQADVFFVHPTTHLRGDRWNADTGNAAINEETAAGSIQRQASVFNCCARVFAPRYRQASIFAFIDESGDGLKALDLAYSDVRAAFTYYLKHENRGRPLIVAGHSQGTWHATLLLKEFLPQIRERLVAAYLIGGAVYLDDFAGPADEAVSAGRQSGTANDGLEAFRRSGRSVDTIGRGPFLKACDRADETGCFVTYRALAHGAKLFRLPVDRRAGEASHCVNPLTWRANDSAPGAAALNAGGVPPDLSRVDPALTDAVCRAGLLYVTPPSTAAYGDAYRVRGGNYHVLDYNLFYVNLRENVAARVAKFLSGGGGR
ncbi:MAG: DUF3089 domain-containing protein [bacterium]|nr:DUF3089 domain-containing protein [bacterium]